MEFKRRKIENKLLTSPQLPIDNEISSIAFLEDVNNGIKLNEELHLHKDSSFNAFYIVECLYDFINLNEQRLCYKIITNVVLFLGLITILASGLFYLDINYQKIDIRPIVTSKIKTNNIEGNNEFLLSEELLTDDFLNLFVQDAIEQQKLEMCNNKILRKCFADTKCTYKSLLWNSVKECETGFCSDFGWCKIADPHFENDNINSLVFLVGPQLKTPVNFSRTNSLYKNFRRIILEHSKKLIFSEKEGTLIEISLMRKRSILNTLPSSFDISFKEPYVNMPYSKSFINDNIFTVQEREIIIKKVITLLFNAGEENYEIDGLKVMLFVISLAYSLSIIRIIIWRLIYFK